MSEAAERSRATQASEWFTLMTRGDIAAPDLDAFRAWRRDPENAAAFEAVKSAWTQAGGLAERPAIAALTEATLAKYAPFDPKVRLSPRFVLRPIAFAAVAVAVLGGGALMVWRVLDAPLVTDVGGQRLEVLADGSRVRLNTDTRLRVAYRDGVRRVVLEHGQAYFDVAHDPQRPFVVVADGAEVRALGTRFDVRHDRQAVQVTLLQGRVQVRAEDGDPTVLTPGQAVAVSRSGVSRPVAVDGGAVTSWTSGRITLRGVPLREAVAEVNRYSTRKVVLDAPEAVSGELVSGQFVAGDVESFVAGARSLYGLRVTAESPREIRLSPG
ncbi:MAG: FecR domain-containing protein [Phenylobacterium sp.]|nr:FecR domain-containing protein [Phenylobacterium sp.]